RRICAPNGAVLLVRRHLARSTACRPHGRSRNARVLLARGLGDGGGFISHDLQGPTIDASQSDTFEAVKHRILVVEDEPAISDNILFVLESEGLEATRVATGLAASALIDQGAVDLIILDIGLPDMNGIDLLKEI